ncbi:MAG: hypothetical protein M3441_22570, partial [Chloroflexota bacterium]|nr:hypothetical protein [Chloroflexota bacterium]
TTLEQGGETTMTQGGETTMMPGGETTTREQGADVGLPAVLENPQRYYGQKLTLSGAVGQVIEAQAFVMVDRQALQGGPLSAVELADRGVLVVHTGGSVPNVAEPQNVRVTGLLQRFDISAFEQQQGINLDDELYTQYEDRPALLAAEIRPTQGELTTQ